MMDNPFAEPGHDDHTVIRPLPTARSARQPMTHTGTSSPPEAEASLVQAPLVQAKTGPEQALPVGVSPMLDAAAPLLSLLGRVRNIASVPDPTALRNSAVGELRRFEQRLRGEKLPLDLIRSAHYALCASLDDVVRNTPWGSHGPWTDSSLVATFHGEVRSGERFFEVLAQLRRESEKFLPVIELMYLCMALGMQGRYRLSPRGPAELDRVREETYAVIARGRQTMERALSPHWQGVSAPFKPLRAVAPMWVVAICGAGLLGLLYVLFLFSLNSGSDRLFAVSLTLPPGHFPTITRLASPQPLPPAPKPPSPQATLAGFLQPEVNEGLVSIAGSAMVPIVRITAAGLFPSASDQLDKRFVPLLAQIGAALRTNPGAVDVVGYTDNQPIHTVAFPSNFQLSSARARAAAALLAGAIDLSRLTTEGRADADPLASNAAVAGREQNRRIEIVLHRSGGQ